MTLLRLGTDTLRRETLTTWYLFPGGGDEREKETVCGFFDRVN